MYKLYNPETNRVIISIDIEWSEWEKTHLEETMNMFRTLNKKYLVPGIYEVVRQDTTDMSYP